MLRKELNLVYKMSLLLKLLVLKLISKYDLEIAKKE